VNVRGVRFEARSIIVLALMMILVVAVMFGIDLTNGRWDEPLLQPQPAL
jgi:hypothetical protein